MNGCEMRGCQFWNGKNCTDDNPLYDDVCRYNDYWNTEEGLEKIKQYESEVGNGRHE